MSIVMGPVLGFRGQRDNGKTWHVSALVVTENEAAARALAWETGGTRQRVPDPTQLKSFNGRTVWRYDLAIPQLDSDQTVTYKVGNSEAYDFVVPAQGAQFRFAYTSCNGFSDPKYAKKVADQNAMWKRMRTEHERRDPTEKRPLPFHLLIMGGDQLYADGLWDSKYAPVINEWHEQWLWLTKKKAPFTPQMNTEVEAFYFYTYCDRWSQPEVAAILARVPTLMMWDDHDIFDGWGSYPPDIQECPVFKGIFEHARAHFCLFQLQTDPGDLKSLPGLIQGQRGRTKNWPSFSFGYRIGDVALLAADLRTERTANQVLSLETWDALHKWLCEQSGCKHLLLLSSIPIVYVNANMLEKALGALPGQWELDDDLRDQWESNAHREERLRLIHRMLGYSKETRCRVTILSGDVHVGALGYIKSMRGGAVDDNSNVINQLISSAIVHTPLGRTELYLLERVMGGKVDQIDRDVTAQMLTFPGTGFYFIGARNFLSLLFDGKHRIWSDWHVENTNNINERLMYTKVVHPVGYNE